MSANQPFAALAEQLSAKVIHSPWGPLGQGFVPSETRANLQSSVDPKHDLRATFPRLSPVVANNQPVVGCFGLSLDSRGATPAEVSPA
jgi:hypothetical protein